MNRKVLNIICYIVIGICALGISYSSYNITAWYVDHKDTEKTIEKVQELITLEEVKPSDEANILYINDAYYKYMNANMLQVDFNELLNINDSVVGWIKVGGTNINYPFVQALDNDYYLHHTLNKSKNEAGWLFLDYRDDKNLHNKNTIIYAHGRTDDTMFGSLKNSLKKKWLNEKDNYVIKISTPNENSLWEVFSTYVIPTTPDYIQTEFETDEEFMNWINIIKDRSTTKFDVELTKDDEILTLSTCYNNTDKMVLHARCIKRETRS